MSFKNMSADPRPGQVTDYSPSSRFTHKYATLLLAANENPKVVSERLGHASITLTMDTDSHVMPDMHQGLGADAIQENGHTVA
jgi:integrase